MKLGVFTPLFNNLSFEEMIDEVAKKGLQTVEIGTGGYPGNAHLDIDKLLASSEARAEYLAKLADKGLEIFDCLGKKVLHMGDNGTGAVAKLAHNTIVGINNLALAEGFSIAAKSGLPAERFLELVQLGSAGSKAAELKGRKIIEHDFTNQFSLALMLKDLKLASSLTDGASIPSPMLNLAKSLFQAGQTQGYGEEDLSSVVKIYESWIGQKIGDAPKPEL